MKRTLLLLALIVVAALTFFFVRRGRERTVPVERPNIVLITIDTLRADRVGRGLTPTLDALAAAGTSFAAARATAPLTLPSHASILTGTYPPVHGVRENGVVFKDGPPTIARVLKDTGYQTAAFVGAYVLDRRFGLADGFDTYDDRVHRDPNASARLEAERPANEVVDAALAWVERAPTPFFLWVHLYDPHAPYIPPAEFKHASSAYDGEVAFADAQAGRLIAALDRRQVRQSTLIAVAGDHGEGLGDHGEQTHGMLAYDTTLKVPLIVAGLGLPVMTVDGPVSLADLASSLLARAGLSRLVPESASGSQLFSTQPPDRDVYAETRYPRAAGWHPLAVLASDPWKLVLSSEAELYDVRADPGETRNLAAERPAIVDGMSAHVKRLQQTTRTEDATVSSEAAERLRALGYVSGGSAQTNTAGAPNPARVIGSWNAFEEALSQLTAGRSRDALPALKALTERHPEALVFRSTFARALQQVTATHGPALAIYRDAVKRWPNDAALYHDLAVAARGAGDAAEAMRAEQAALVLEPDNPAALNGLGLLHADAGRSADAATAFARAANADPTNASYWTNLGNARRELGDTARAEAAYRRALDADPRYADALNGLGVLLVQQRRPSEAVTWFERALQHAPDLHEARLNLGIAYQESGQREKAAGIYRQLLATRGAQGSRERKAAAELLKQLK